MKGAFEKGFLRQCFDTAWHNYQAKLLDELNYKCNWGSFKFEKIDRQEEFYNITCRFCECSVENIMLDLLFLNKKVRGKEALCEHLKRNLVKCERLFHDHLENFITERHDKRMKSRNGRIG